MHLSNRIYLVLQIHLFYTLALKSTLPPHQPTHLLTQFLPQNFALPTNNTNAFPPDPFTYATLSGRITFHNYGPLLPVFSTHKTLTQASLDCIAHLPHQVHARIGTAPLIYTNDDVTLILAPDIYMTYVYFLYSSTLEIPLISDTVLGLSCYFM